MGVAGGGGGGALCPSCREHLAKRQVLEKKGILREPTWSAAQIRILKKEIKG